MAILRYPENLDGSGSDYIKFQFYNYKPALSGGVSNKNSSYNSSTSNLSKSDIANKAGVDAIVITMPNDIASNISGDWGAKGMSGLTRAAFGAIGGAVDAGSNFFNAKQAKTINVPSAVKDVISGVAGGFAEDAIRGAVESINKVPGLGSNLTTSDVLGLVSGFIVNPNTELLYQGTSLRKHGYRFKLIAQSEKEADDILKIANLFKQIAAPKGEDQKLLGLENRNFIGIPDICQVSFHQSGTTGEHPFLPRYKKSAITSVGVDYVTEGQYMTFSDGKPIGINLTLEFTELKLLFSEEIGTGANQYR